MKEDRSTSNRYRCKTRPTRYCGMTVCVFLAPPEWLALRVVVVSQVSLWRYKFYESFCDLSHCPHAGSDHHKTSSLSHDGSALAAPSSSSRRNRFQSIGLSSPCVRGVCDDLSSLLLTLTTSVLTGKRTKLGADFVSLVIVPSAPDEAFLEKA